VLLSAVVVITGVSFAVSRATFWIVLGCVGVLIVITVWLNRHSTSNLRRLADVRGQESICTFARAFRRHQVDPWIIRAVYEEVQAQLASDVVGFPIRVTDRPEDLHIDPEDFEYMILDIARRVGRSTSQWELNPMYSRAHSLGDVVLLLNNQPRIRTA
jgi:hypothetical protein